MTVGDDGTTPGPLAGACAHRRVSALPPSGLATAPQARVRDSVEARVIFLRYGGGMTALL